MSANADDGLNADRLGVLDDQLQFGVLFDDRNDPPADLLGQHHHLDVLVVFEAVADDGRFVIGDGQHGQEFGLRAGFKAEVIGAAELEDFFDHLTLLIDLDRVNAAIAALVAVLADGVVEGLMHLAQAVLEDVRKTDQDGQRNAAPLQAYRPVASRSMRAIGLFVG